MSATLAMFPGQGSQRPGMARHLLERYPRSAGRFLYEAGELLDLPLAELCTTGSAAELSRTELTQPAVLAVSLAVHEALRKEHGFVPDAVAGHSLGEYAALVAAEVLDAGDALRLVRRRAQLMAEAGRATPGGMTAVIGLDAARVEALCADPGLSAPVEVANYNDASQTVVAGEREAVAAVARRAAEAGAERVVPLPVSAPFHSSLMRAVEPLLAAELADVAFRRPVRPVLSSVTGRPLSSGEEARLLLARQPAAPVRWVDVLRTAEAAGTRTYVEVGPGRVLCGFVRGTLPGATARSTHDSRQIEALARSLESVPALPVPA
ncbi:ACP S-malonyltransferase [Streptomyces sp. NPDC058758]|uniref:ACP S-malonyltransferase n=1 Tax=unclassified Streptomyces TaxID=2593676 RepID=UPI0036CD405C